MSPSTLRFTSESPNHGPAPHLEGKANKEIIAFLSKTLKVTKSAVEVVHGTSGRIKLVEIPDDTDLGQFQG